MGGVSGPASRCLRVSPPVAPDPSPLHPRASSCPLGQAPLGPPQCLSLLSTHTTLLVDPGSPSGPSPVAGPLCRLLGRYTPRRLHEPPSRGGLQLQGVRSPLRSPWCPVSASPGSCGLPLLHRGNTRYAWVVRPYPRGTFTPQETPSFTWRTNAAAAAGCWVLPHPLTTESRRSV
jgi:hypothetical protein